MSDVLSMEDTVRLQHQLQELVDRDQVGQLIHRLSMYLDEGRFGELPGILTEDATARTPGGVAEGREAVVGQAGRNHAAEQGIQHLITNLLVDLDGDRAKVRANHVATFTGVGAAPDDRLAPEAQYVLGGIYSFEARRTPDGWRLSHIETTPTWTTGTRPTPAPAPA
jgi:hypothetical protein